MAVDLQESGSKLRRSRSFETLCPNVSSVCELEFTVAIWLLITAQLRLSLWGTCRTYLLHLLYYNRATDKQRNHIAGWK